MMSAHKMQVPEEHVKKARYLAEILRTATAGALWDNTISEGEKGKERDTPLGRTGLWPCTFDDMRTWLNCLLSALELGISYSTGEDDALLCQLVIADITDVLGACAIHVLGEDEVNGERVAEVVNRALTYDGKEGSGPDAPLVDRLYKIRLRATPVEGNPMAFCLSASARTCDRHRLACDWAVDLRTLMRRSA